MTVFIAQGWMRVAATMPGPKDLRITDGTSGSRGPGAIKRRRACPAKRVSAKRACPAKRASAKQGRADGSSACPGGSPSEPGGVSTKATIPGDMQQTAKSIRVRNAGERLLLWPVQPQRWASPHAGPARADACGSPCAGCESGTRAPVSHDAGATGAASRLAVPHAPFFGGDGIEKDRRALWPDKTRGDDARLLLKSSP